MTRVIIHIGRLVLDGYARADRDAIAAGLRDELVRHYGDPAAVGGLPGHSGLERLRAGPVPVAAAAQPSAVGRQAARAITKGLAR